MGWGINELVIQQKDYESKEDFDDAIKKAVTCLLDNDYIMTVRYDEKCFGIAVIEFETNDLSIAQKSPYWLSIEEYEDFIMFKNNRKAEE